MFKEYFKELKGLDVHETEYGFALYKIELPYVYIRDIYVKPEYRNAKVASTMADDIVRHSKMLGCTHMIGDVEPSNENSTDSVKVLLAYGMTVLAANDDEILFVKEI